MLQVLMNDNQKTIGYIIHEGVTNGHNFVCVATLETSNPKTGNMIQVWFLLKDINPVEALKLGLDAETICKDCPFANGQGCYVVIHQAPLQVWKKYHEGRYQKLDPKDYAKVFRFRKVRFGAYGNPSLLPISIIKSIAKVCQGWTGYFHDWKTNPLANEYSKYFMASTETLSSYKLAKSLAYRVFHVSPNKPEGSRECANSSHNLTCENCNLCDGGNGRDVWINPHGSFGKDKKAIAVALSA